MHAGSWNEHPGVHVAFTTEEGSVDRQLVAVSLKAARRKKEVQVLRAEVLALQQERLVPAPEPTARVLESLTSPRAEYDRQYKLAAAQTLREMAAERDLRPGTRGGLPGTRLRNDITNYFAQAYLHPDGPCGVSMIFEANTLDDIEEELHGKPYWTKRYCNYLIQMTRGGIRYVYLDKRDLGNFPATPFEESVGEVNDPRELRDPAEFWTFFDRACAAMDDMVTLYDYRTSRATVGGDYWTGKYQFRRFVCVRCDDVARVYGRQERKQWDTEINVDDFRRAVERVTTDRMDGARREMQYLERLAREASSEAEEDAEAEEEA